MNRTEIHEGNPMTVTAFSEAIGLRAAAPQSPEPPHGGRAMSRELRDADDAAKGRQRGPVVLQRPDPEPLRRALFEATLGRAEPLPDAAPVTVTPAVIRQVVSDEIAEDIRRAEQSFVWREPVTVEEFLSGADGQYRSVFRQG